MIESDKVIVLDIDGTLCYKRKSNESYLDVLPIQSTLDKVKEYKKMGFYIILFTARQMRTHEGNVGKINAVTGKELFAWLEKFEIPFDEVHLGKPWCGHNGFYVDDKAIRPDEFEKLSYEEIIKLTS